MGKKEQEMINLLLILGTFAGVGFIIGLFLVNQPLLGIIIGFVTGFLYWTKR